VGRGGHPPPPACFTAAGGGGAAAAPPPCERGDAGALYVVSPDTGRFYECAIEIRWNAGNDLGRTLGARFLGPLREVLAAS
jgi:hypothetical protein